MKTAEQLFWEFATFGPGVTLLLTSCLLLIWQEGKDYAKRAQPAYLRIYEPLRCALERLAAPGYLGHKQDKSR
jgi:hypothetical protein